MVGPLLQSFGTTFYRPLSVYDNVTMNSLMVNLNKITVNSTIFLPLWVRTAAGVASTRFVGLPLTKVGQIRDSLNGKHTFHAYLKDKK